MRRWAISWWEEIFFSIINIPVTLFVKSNPIPTHPIKELHIGSNQPVLYVLPYNSKIDLMVVTQLAKQCDLPNPISGITINGNTYPSFIFIDSNTNRSTSNYQKKYILPVLSDLLIELQKNSDLDIQLLPVTVLFNRKPDKQSKKKLSTHLLTSFSKFFNMLFSGYDCYTHFSRPVSLKNLAGEENNVQQLAKKFFHVIHLDFTKQRFATMGPILPHHRAMINQLLHSSTLTEAIHEEAKNKNISPEEAKKNAYDMLNEISAKYTYWAPRITGLILTWAWSRLYQGLKIHNANSVRELAQNGHEIVYAPCHRSHMDYLLLSYVLYRQGLMPPHITAGINLNFWPAGFIFRRLGAFFIRRSFRGNKLYTAVFREYLAELFTRGYSVEYFIEGGRSRTGRLLDPKTGMLMMTIQIMLRGDPKPITIVPVYIGYEHVLEVATYANELRGAAKKKENLWQTIKAFCKLKKLGYGYVNFGEPVSLNQFLDHQVPNWRDTIEPQRPSWLTPTTNQLSIELMQNINRAAAVNPMNLCCTILLDAENNTLTTSQLLEQMDYLLALLRHVPYDKSVTIPDKNAVVLFEHARQMGKFIINHVDGNEMISLSQEQAVLMTYYRNNIQHLLIIPALIARIIINCYAISRDKLIDKINYLYPFVKAELFLYKDKIKLEIYINHLINKLIQLTLIQEKNNQLYTASSNIANLSLLAASADDSLQRYAIVFSLLHNKPDSSRLELEKKSRNIAKKISIQYGINSPEFFDKSVFVTLINTLREQDFLNSNDSDTFNKITQIYAILKPLIAHDAMQTIKKLVNNH